MAQGKIPFLTCDDCGKVSDILINCYCRKVTCPECRGKRHSEHSPFAGINQPTVSVNTD